MAIVRSKGSVLSISGGGLSGAVGQLLSWETSGNEIDTFDGTTLDNASPYYNILQNGYVNPGEVSGEVYYDPTLHDWAYALCDASPVIPFTVTVSYGPSSVGTRSHAAAGISVGTKVSMKDGVRLTFKIKRTGPKL